ncbi:hypothetical protein GOARA_035_00150 [Gordonia araii NBRC 100433]|uniref:Uncharacterized protein n=1 Tax=Gordonia araii NBRC 100433 TaxID=1073574 RepID=G7H084_9ACTN|nr:hypothetical protein [Gordonia araii]GAB09259.1 hypothetical protein GOARA_035_00150 [Gordonia araii NBRC 100433]
MPRPVSGPKPVLGDGTRPPNPQATWPWRAPVTATVADPFGNVIGLMYSPHYLEVLAAPSR